MGAYTCAHACMHCITICIALDTCIQCTSVCDCRMFFGKLTSPRSSEPTETSGWNGRLPAAKTDAGRLVFRHYIMRAQRATERLLAGHGLVGLVGLVRLVVLVLVLVLVRVRVLQLEAGWRPLLCSARAGAFWHGCTVAASYIAVAVPPQTLYQPSRLTSVDSSSLAHLPLTLSPSPNNNNTASPSIHTSYPSCPSPALSIPPSIAMSTTSMSSSSKFVQIPTDLNPGPQHNSSPLASTRPSRSPPPAQPAPRPSV